MLKSLHDFIIGVMISKGFLSPVAVILGFLALHLLLFSAFAEENGKTSPTLVPEPTDPIVTPIQRGEETPENTTKITADESRFNSKTNMVRFENHVELVKQDGSLNLKCDVLDVELLQNGEEKDEAAAKGQTDSIKTATARGFVVIETTNSKGKPVFAFSRHAIFDALKKRLVLSDFPKLLDGNQKVEATGPTTKMYLHTDGTHSVEGPSRTIFVDSGSLGGFQSR